MRFIGSGIFFLLSAISISAQEIPEEQLEKFIKKPENLQGTIVKSNGERFIRLIWGDEPHEDMPNLEYLLYVAGIGKELALQASIDIRKNTYDYPVHNRFGKLYQFQVETVYQKDFKYLNSPISDTLSVYVPSKDLPKVNIWPIEKNGAIVTLQWKYSDEIDDLEGFRLYENGELIRTEKEIPKHIRQWDSPPLKPGKYEYQIEAISKFAIKSELSKPRYFDIVID